MNKLEQLETVKKICAPGKGILAADESTSTIGKRFSSINIENTQDNRIAYRDLLFTTPNLNKHISGVITFEETLLGYKKDGNKLIQSLLDNNIIVGIKVDGGVKPLYGTDGETVTQGIDNLDEKCQKYYNAGARFAKWRAVLKIDVSKNLPSELSIHENAVTLARYASICQNNGLVPIVEPEILMDGDHSIETSYEVAVNVLSNVYRELIRHNVDLECTLLKPNMIRSGVSSSEDFDSIKLAQLTIRALQQAVPVSVPGIVFLSGGMSEVEASISLNEINKVNSNKPWYLTFSYGRALQASVLDTWKGEDANIKLSQDVLLLRAKANGLASLGKYTNDEDVGKSLYETNYVY
jgi:fructose-bisphosphate aldolase, class I